MADRAIFTGYIRDFSEHKDRAFFISEDFAFDRFEELAKHVHHKYACIAINRYGCILHFNFSRISKIYGKLSKVDACPENWKIYIYKY